MKTLIQFVLILSTSIISSASVAQDWDLIGSSKVHGRRDYDEIQVTRLRGTFSALKLKVEVEGIEFDRVLVAYANGGKDELVLRDFIPAGGESRVLDLRGNDRIIRSIRFFYKSNPITVRKARVVVFGRR